MLAALGIRFGFEQSPTLGPLPDIRFVGGLDGASCSGESAQVVCARGRRCHRICGLSGALLLRFDGAVPATYWSSAVVIVPSAAVGHVVVNHLFGAYSNDSTVRRVTFASLLIGRWFSRSTSPWTTAVSPCRSLSSAHSPPCSGSSLFDWQHEDGDVTEAMPRLGERCRVRPARWEGTRQGVVTLEVSASMMSPRQSGGDAQLEPTALALGIETPARVIVAVNKLRVSAGRAVDATRIVLFMMEGRHALTVGRLGSSSIGQRSSPCPSKSPQG